MGRKGKGGRGGRGGRGKQTPGGQNNPAVPVSDPADTVSTPAAPRREFPRNVIFAILIRLPVKSVLRFTCASKSWRTVVSLPAFATAHLSLSPTGLLVFAHTEPIPGDDADPQPINRAIYAYRPPNPKYDESSTVDRILDGFPPMDVVGTAPNGVVCIVQQRAAQKFTLWNPSIGHLLHIPDPVVPIPDFLESASAGLGYNPDNKKYSVIRIVRFRNPILPDAAQIFNFQTGRWASAGKVTFRAVGGTCDAVVAGVPFWRAMEDEPDLGPVLKLVWYDVRFSRFDSQWFEWVEPEKKEMQLGEVREGFLGAIVWDREQGALEDRVLDVWTRDANGLWTQTYRVEPGSLPVLGRVVGFYGEEELVQEILIGRTDEACKPALCRIRLGGDLAVRDYCWLVGAILGTCSLTRYKQSLIRLPKIGSAMIDPVHLLTD